jgi:hypothetical protein
MEERREKGHRYGKLNVVTCHFHSIWNEIDIVDRITARNALLPHEYFPSRYISKISFTDEQINVLPCCINRRSRRQPVSVNS